MHQIPKRGHGRALEDQPCLRFDLVCRPVSVRVAWLLERKRRTETNKVQSTRNARHARVVCVAPRSSAFPEWHRSLRSPEVGANGIDPRGIGITCDAAMNGMEFQCVQWCFMFGTGIDMRTHSSACQCGIQMCIRPSHRLSVSNRRVGDPS